MYRSCPLVQNFAKQGLKIRIRKESGPRPSRYVHSKRKTIRKAIHTSDDDLMMNKNKPIIPKPRAITTAGAALTTVDSEEDEEDDEYELDEDGDDEDDESHQQQPIYNNRKVTHINHLLSHPAIKSTIDAQLSVNGHNPNISAFKRVNTGN